MQEVELTSTRLASVWWAFTWRFAALWLALLALSLGACCITGILLVKAGVLTTHVAAKMAACASLAAMLAGVPVAGITAVRVALNKGLGTFRLALLLVPPKPEPKPESLAAAS